MRNKSISDHQIYTSGEIDKNVDLHSVNTHSFLANELTLAGVIRGIDNVGKLEIKNFVDIGLNKAKNLLDIWKVSKEAYFARQSLRLVDRQKGGILTEIVSSILDTNSGKSFLDFIKKYNESNSLKDSLIKVANSASKSNKTANLLGNFCRSFGAGIGVWGMFESGKSLTTRIENGDWLGSSLEAINFVSSGLGVGAVLIDSALLSEIGIIGGSLTIGWFVGNKVVENTSIIDDSLEVGDYIEALTGSRNAGALGAAFSSALSTPMYLFNSIQNKLLN